MHPFKKMIYMLRKSTSLTVLPTISLMVENSSMCYGEVSLKVRTTIPVKINITATFETSGGYASSSYLTGINQKYADVVNEVISSMTIYNFGIDASQTGTYSNYSQIVLTINDNDTDAEIASYTFSRLHASINC